MRLADSHILSHLKYGEEILSLSAQLQRKIQVCENNIMKQIMKLPNSTSSSGIIHITGRTSTEYRQRLRRITNFCRLQRMAPIGITKLGNDTKMTTSSDFLPRKTQDDLAELCPRHKTRNQRFYVPHNLVFDNDISIERCKPLLRRFFRKKSHTENYRYLSKNQRNSILSFNTRHPDNTVLEQTGPEINSLIGWKLGITAIERFTNKIIDGDDYTCPLCNEQPLDTPQTHLLTECSGTNTPRTQFSSSLQNLSPEYSKTYNDLPQHDKSTWILTSGENDNSKFWHNNEELKIIEGDSIPGVVKKRDNIQATNVIEHYNRIKSSIGKNSVKIYTDGAKSHNISGSGFTVYKGNINIHSGSSRLINCGVDSAELHAIHEAVQYLQNNLKPPAKTQIHIFTDSRHALDSIAEHSQISRNHRIINKIQKTIKQLRIELVLH